MKILHRYLLTTFLRNLGLSLLAFTALFLVIDFFDRIDNILPEDASFFLIAYYFLLKIPHIVSVMLPIATLVATLFTIGMLSKHSEITAMRASGLTVGWIARPLFFAGAVLSFCSIALNESLVPYATRRAREIYNLDIQKKQEEGVYNQSDFWWRSGNSFYSAAHFDSRNDTLHDLVRFDLTDTFDVVRRVNAVQAQFLIPYLGWTMREVTEFRFTEGEVKSTKMPTSIPLNISEVPRDFYDIKTDPQTLSYRELKRFIKTQANNGVSTREYLADLYAKLSSPFLIFLVIPVVLPFALKPARSGSLAVSFIAALGIGFSYYIVHSLSLALGRGDVWSPLLAAWMANVLMGVIGTILLAGSESPN